jgi:5'-methylthioadenosine phosphorylase
VSAQNAIHAKSRPDIGIIGGSGFYSFLEQAETCDVDTPFGKPSAPIAVGRVADRQVAFLPRHGRRHEFPAHLVNYRANLWALRSVGVRQVLGPSAVGSLKPELSPGTFVIPDQLVDRTWGRKYTVYDRDGSAVHMGFAEPYCPRGRQALLQNSNSETGELAAGGTLVIINGPRFSTRAESQWHAAAGWSLVGMTSMPEAAIARELAMCYSTIALVTDHDAGIAGGAAVSQDEVFRQFAANIERMKNLLIRAIADLPPPESDEKSPCPCRRALDGIELPITLP